MELCPNCEIPLENDTCPKCGFKHVGPKIKIEVGRSVELEALRAEKTAVEKELSEKTSILEQQAMSEFEQLRENLAEQFNDDSIKDCSSPSEMFSYIASLKKKPTTEQKKPPHGKSTFIPPSNAEQYGSYAELIDALYNTAYYSKNATADERLEAKAKIETLFESLIEGRSWEQLKRSKAYNAIIKNVESCSSCGKTLINGTVCSCGYNPYSKKHKPRNYERGM